MKDFFNKSVKIRDRILITINDSRSTRLEYRLVIGKDNKFGGTLYTISEFYKKEIEDYIENFQKGIKNNSDNIRTSQFIIIESEDFKSNHL